MTTSALRVKPFKRQRTTQRGRLFDDESFGDVLKEFLGKVPKKITVLQYIVHMHGHEYPLKTISNYLLAVGDWMTTQRRQEEWEAIMQDPDIRELEEAVRKLQDRAGLIEVVPKSMLTIDGLIKLADA
ncbi:hypothetical protein DFS34DRAFT_653871 [Phlyctochytrium arcticum]|nr:hypothetical protein DFS34DRAFT_653871 [Phlyctochytrium arcticum]